jgi:hypothetical protein
MAIEAQLLAHLEQLGYHPRTAKHSDFQSLIIIHDLVAQCPLIARRAASGELVAKLRHHQQVGHADWVVDIAMGTAAGVPKPPTANPDGLVTPTISMVPPVIIQIAIELKSIWTEHGKARLNRLRDFNSFHGYAHQYSQNTIAAGFLLVNSSERFWSPLRRNDDITVHGTPRKPARQLAKETVDRFRSIHLRDGIADIPGMEAIGVVVIEHDNLLRNPDREKYTGLHRPTRVAPTPPSPVIGDPLDRAP